MMRTVLVVVVVLIAGSGCGGSSGAGGGSLDCAWLGGDNCWKSTLDDAASCLPPATDHGTLSADNKTCTYASGVAVTFTPALVLPVPDQPSWNFTIANGGTTCLHFENANAAGIKLVTKGNTVTERPSGALGIAITCPDGTTVATSNALNLLDCNADAGASLGGLPGNAWSSTSTSVSVGLLGASQSMPAFNCQR
ncbi:MAG TPA: hypothetical protein VMU50_17270 [Polyangia bacterium]|nr:hypothetical protein [Polyangia bacterium]